MSEHFLNAMNREVVAAAERALAAGDMASALKTAVVEAGRLARERHGKPVTPEEYARENVTVINCLYCEGRLVEIRPAGA